MLFRSEWSVQRSLVPPFAGADSKDWRITTKQFRRTLAWFIARRPGGSIAGAMQFRHLSIQMFEGYAGTSQAGFRVEVEAEQALVRGEQLLALTDNHTHDLVGPAAKKGLDRLKNFRDKASFQGVVADNPVQLQRLMERNDPAIYIGELVTCIFDPDKALCLKGKRTGDGPALSMCDPFRCTNVAFTKANTIAWKVRIRELEDRLENGPKLAPHIEDALVKDLAAARARIRE